MNILILGGAGFIGTKLTRKFLDLGFNVTIYDKFIEQVHGKTTTSEYLSRNFKKKKPFIYLGCVTETDNFKKLFQAPFDKIYYLVSETGTAQSMGEISRYSLTNIHGPSVFFDALIKYCKNKPEIILASSRAVYGEGGGFSNKKLNPLSYYGLNKKIQEDIFSFFCKEYKFPLKIYRFQNIYGAGQSINNPYTGVLIHFIKNALINKDIEIFDNGKITRDFLHIDDLTDFLIEDNSKNNIIDIGSGKRVELKDVVLLIKEITNSKSNFLIKNKHRPGDVIHACSKNKIKIKTPLKTGLIELVNFIKNAK